MKDQRPERPPRVHDRTGLAAWAVAVAVVAVLGVIALLYWLDKRGNAPAGDPGTRVVRMVSLDTRLVASDASAASSRLAPAA